MTPKFSVGQPVKYLNAKRIVAHFWFSQSIGEWKYQLFEPGFSVLESQLEPDGPWPGEDRMAQDAANYHRVMPLVRSLAELPYCGNPHCGRCGHCISMKNLKLLLGEYQPLPAKAEGKA